jgi:hypothetical protein
MNLSKTTSQKIEDAYERSSHWLAEGNQANEAGKKAKAEKCFEKSQKRLDKAMHLQGAYE